MSNSNELQVIEDIIQISEYEKACSNINIEAIQSILKQSSESKMFEIIKEIYLNINTEQLVNHSKFLFSYIEFQDFSVNSSECYDDILKLCEERGKSEGNDLYCYFILKKRVEFNEFTKRYDCMIEALWCLESHVARLRMHNELLENIDEWFTDLVSYPEEYQLQVWFYKGVCYFESMKYMQAITCYEKAEQFASVLCKYQSQSNCNERIGVTYGVMGNYAMQLQYHLFAKEIREKHSINEKMGNSFVNLGLCYKNLGDINNAILYYQEGINWQFKYERHYDAFVGKMLLAMVIDLVDEKILILEEVVQYFRSIQDENRLADALHSMFQTFVNANKYDDALRVYNELLDLLSGKSIDMNLGLTYKTMGELFLKKESENYDVVSSEMYLKQAIDIFRALDIKDYLYQTLQVYSGLLEDQKRWEDFAITYKEYHILKEAVLNSEVQMKLHSLEAQRLRDNAEHERKIQRVQIEEQVKLLHNVLPAEIAERILSGEKQIAEYAESVSVFFFDIVGFTEISGKMSPIDLLEGLNRIFTEIDHIAIDYSIEKIKTIGDAYMAVAGLPKAIENHAEKIADFALAIQKKSRNWYWNNVNINFRMGLHCGPVISGIIGSKRFAFDIWGDTVNIASRMESNGHAGRIHISKEFKELLQDNQKYKCVYRDLIDIKGRGIVETFWLEETEYSE
jgi:class 3 adenylate cyclase